MNLLLGGASATLGYKLRQARNTIAEKDEALEICDNAIDALNADVAALQQLISNATNWTLADTDAANLLPQLTQNGDGGWSLRLFDSLTNTEYQLSETMDGFELLNIDGRSKPQVWRVAPPGSADMYRYLQMSLDVGRLLALTSENVDIGYYGRAYDDQTWEASKHISVAPSILMFPKASTPNPSKIETVGRKLFNLEYTDSLGLSRSILCEALTADQMHFSEITLVQTISDYPMDYSNGVIIQVDRNNTELPAFFAMGVTSPTSVVTVGAMPLKTSANGVAAQPNFDSRYGFSTVTVNESMPIDEIVVRFAQELESVGMKFTPVTGQAAFGDRLKLGTGFINTEYLIGSEVESDGTLTRDTEVADGDYGWARERTTLHVSNIADLYAALGPGSTLDVRFATWSHGTSVDQTRDHDDFFVKPII